MSRSGYVDDDWGCDDNWAGICWRGAVKSAIRGKRGQEMLRELLAALDAMPNKELIADELQADGSYCALGVLGAKRGITLSAIDPYNYRQVAETFGIAQALAREIVEINDSSADEEDWVDIEVCGPMREHRPDWGEHRRSARVDLAAEQVARDRWEKVRKWVAAQIKEAV